MSVRLINRSLTALIVAAATLLTLLVVPAGAQIPPLPGVLGWGLDDANSEWAGPHRL